MVIPSNKSRNLLELDVLIPPLMCAHVPTLCPFVSWSAGKEIDKGRGSLVPTPGPNPALGSEYLAKGI